nr:hypothetical protein [Escherichia coli]EFF7328345.1 hypothetical protein [Escherichia coli]EFF7788370.1 hypothetical protein [Escherichia coli]EFF7790144.1 hypothetical protein [Escherichia coli]
MGQGACIVQEGQQGKTERQHPVTGVCPEVRESQPWLDAFASSGTEVSPDTMMAVSCSRNNFTCN